jgi:putative ABC transport system permease protein
MNDFRTAWRGLLRQKTSSLINILGLALGMAAACLVLLWVNNEFHYDNFQPGASRTWLVGLKETGKPGRFAGTPAPLAGNARTSIAGVENATSCEVPNLLQNPVLTLRNTPFREKRVVFVDREWFRFFHYDFLAGNPVDFSSQLHGLILTQTLARKYFGRESAIGQIIRVDSVDFKVQGVVADNPSNSSFQFELFIPVDAYLGDPSVSKPEAAWMNFTSQTFVRTDPRMKGPALAASLAALFHAHSFFDKVSVLVTPLAGMHFDTGQGEDTFPHEDRKVVLIFAAIGILLLGIACINYVNLSTARASLRTREVGIRKIIGAGRGSLFRRFMAESLLTESLLTSGISFALTLLFIGLALPAFNRFTERNFVLSPDSPQVWQVMGLTLLLCVILTGVYPALLLSSFRPLNMLRGIHLLQVKSSSLRKTLVVFQFSVAIALLIGTLVIFRQLHFIQDVQEGYNRSQIFLFRLPKSSGPRKVGAGSLKQEMLKCPSVEAVTAVSDDMSHLIMSMGGGVDWTGKPHGLEPLVSPLWVDPDFRRIFHLVLREGRWFAPDRQANQHNYILNEEAVREFGLQKPCTGQYFSFFGDSGRIIGVVQDFHFNSFRRKIGAVVLMDNPGWENALFVQATVQNMRAVLNYSQAQWQAFFPGQPFEYHFMDEQFGQTYRADLKTSTLLGVFSGIAVLISCLGLFGLALFTAEQRNKEVSIRKLLGASAFRITVLLSADFLRLVLVATCIGSPIAGWAMQKWLQDFVYRIPLSAGIFLLAGSLAFLVALCTVGFQAARTALANPARALRSE